MANKYVINALWTAAQDALNHKDVEALQDILESIVDQSSDIQKKTNPIPISDVYFENVEYDDQKIPFDIGSTYVGTVLNFLDYHDCWDKFIKSNPTVYSDFTVQDYRDWLKSQYQKELKVLEKYAPKWEHYLNHVLAEHYMKRGKNFSDSKNIERLRKGHYRVLRPKSLLQSA